MTLPVNLFLIGGQKCGTTKLADILALHPDVCLQEGKESGYYAHNYHRGIEWYHGHFSDPGKKYCLDASVTYSQIPLDAPDDREYAPQRIRRDNPDAKFLYIVRDPAERTFSAYMHMVRQQREKLPFEEAIEADAGYIDTSNYAAQLRRYLECFPRESFLILRYSRLSSDPLSLFTGICDFLDIEPIAVPPEVLHKYTNRGFQFTPTGLLIRKIFRSNESFKRHIGTVKKLVPTRLKSRAAAFMVKSNPVLTSGQRALVEQKLPHLKEELRQLTGEDLQGW